MLAAAVKPLAERLACMWFGRCAVAFTAASKVFIFAARSGVPGEPAWRPPLGGTARNFQPCKPPHRCLPRGAVERRGWEMALAEAHTT